MRIYENVLKTSDNRLPQRAYYIPKGKSEYTLLNGEWRFSYYKRDIDMPLVINNWDKITVPSCWQLLGYENPNYVDISYPYPYDPPYVPDENPCGVYEKDFQIDNIWGKIYFVLEGVSSCAYIYVNGEYVGFTQGSHLQAEFDITDFVNEGNNTIRICVYKWCVGSYLEDQDFFRFNGIFRDTYLLQRPYKHINDIHIETKENKIVVTTDNVAEVTALDMEGNIIGTATDKKVEFAVENPVFWNAEKPYLYTVRLKKDDEIIELETGFRTIAISNSYQLLINGVSVKLHGVNHHDTHPKNGWCVTNEELEKELLLMKDLNINCIRTSHYPPTPYFLNLCDKIGFYVILETDIETHGAVCRYGNAGIGYDSESSDWTCTKPEWEHEYVERMQRTVYRDRNHPSIIMWSTGNESGHGPNHKAMIEFIRSENDGRLVHCEDASRKDMIHSADVYSRMYINFEDLKKFADDPKIDMPIFLCEYAHSMGNGPGDVYEYNELFDSNDKFIGGCVWEWADHTVVVDGVQRYGGDFEGELINDGNYCCDGMVFSDRSLKAGSYEVKAAYQPIRTELSQNFLKITNRLDFTNLNEFEFRLVITCDKNVVAEKTSIIDIQPHMTDEVKLVIPKLCGELGAFVVCELRKDNKLYARTQHELPMIKTVKELSKEIPELCENATEIIVKGNNFEYVFSKFYGNFTSLKIKGKENLAGTVKLSSWRAPTDNDCNEKKYWGFNGIWQGEYYNKTFSKVYSCTYSDGAITVCGALAGISHVPYFKYTAVYKINKDGVIDIALNGQIGEKNYPLPRLGFEFVLPKENKQFAYFGYGPYESYIDTHHGSIIGWHKSNTDKEYVNYVRPQEHGNHYGVRKLEIGNLSFTGTNFEINVSNYSTNAIEIANHTDELKSDGLVHLRVDYKVSGIGSQSCGPKIQDKYRLTEKEISFVLRISPL